MTPPVAPMANLAPAPSTSGSSSSSDASSASSSAAGHKFSVPMQQARQQLARQRDDARPATTKSSSSSSSTSATSSTSSSQAKAAGKPDRKDDDTAETAAQGAAAAMLTLLGQSVPASAAASAVSSTEGDDATAAVSGAGPSATAILPASTTLSLLGAIQGNATAQGKAGDGGEFAKAMNGIKDKSLSMAGQAADDAGDTVDATTTDSAQASKGDAMTNALQALTASSSSSGQKDGSDPLEALKNLSAAALSPQPLAQPAATTAATPHVLTMQSSVGTPAFGQELSQQVTWLGGQDVKEARIRLHPEDLGELDVKVSVKQDHVDVAFIAQHPQAVHAVQQTLTQLDSMLAHHGLSLGEAMVGQGSTGQGSSSQTANASGSSSSGGSSLAEEVGDIVSAVSPLGKVAVGLVDMFA